MPGMDRSGPLGQGAMTGRGMGVCTGRGSGRALGPGRGMGSGRGGGRGMRINCTAVAKTLNNNCEESKEQMTERLAFLRQESELLEKRLLESAGEE